MLKKIKSIPPLFILAMCLLLTLLLTIFTYRLINQRHNDRLSQLSEILTGSIVSRMQRYEKALIHIKAYLKTNQQVDRKTFSEYVQLLNLQQHYPGIQGLGFTIRIPHHQLAAYEESVREQGFPDFKVWPDYPRDEYFSIHFLEPFGWRNQRAFGFDMFSQPYRQKTMARARDQAVPVLTEVVELVQETANKKQPGFLLYLPLYKGDTIPGSVPERREKLRGFVYAPFRAHDFFSEIFEEDIAIQSEINVEIYDGENIEAEKLIYNNDLLLTNPPGSKSAIRLERIIHPNNHSWTVVTTFRRSFELLYEEFIPWLVALVGSLLSFLIFWIVHSAKSHAADMEKSITRFNALVENLTEGLIFAYPNGDIQLMNKVASEIYHFSAFEELLYKKEKYNSLINFKTLDGQEVALESRPINRVVRGEKYANYELEFTHLATGESHFISYGGTPIYNRDGQLVLAVVTVKDITEKINNAIELQKALAARDEFVSISSHELKTPLTSLKLKAQLFRRKLNKKEGVTAEEIQKFSADTDHQVTRLTRLAEDMLDVSRIRSGQFSLLKEQVEVCELVNGLLDQIKPQFLAAGYQEPLINCTGQAQGHWDRLRIEQVINNLLTNAIRYGEGKPVMIDVVVLAKTVQISVKDLGAGISTEQQQRIFNRFERLNEVHETTGLGLGLFLSQKIVQAHEGKIWVESEPGKGSVFTVELPIIVS